jgi:hypothetical protein
MKVKILIKRILIGIVLFSVAMFVLGLILQKTGYQAPTKNEVSTSSKTEENNPTESVEYELIDSTMPDVPRDIAKWSIAPLVPMHFAGAKRYARPVVIYQRLNKSQLEKLADIVIADTKKEVDFNAFVIHFYDYEEFIEYSVRLGQVYYVPNGRWEDASKTKTGDYKKFKKVSQLFEPDWSNALTQKEAIIMKDFLRLNHKYIDEATNALLAGDKNYPNPDETATREIAKKHGLDISVMEAIVKRYYKGYDTRENN